MPTINIGGQQINISEEEAQALFRASTASGFIWVTRANPLPTIGTSGVIYVNKSTLDVYLWDSLTQKYIITGFTKEDGTPADTTSLSEVISAIDRLTSATANGLSNTFITYELATNENHDIVLKGSDGSESKLSIRTKADENTTYQLSLVGNNLKLSGSDGSESFVLLPESSGTRPITYVLTRSVEGDIVLRGSDGSTSMINFKPDTNTTYTLEKDADGNFLFRDSTGMSITLEDAIGDDFNTTYTLSAEGTTIKLTDSEGNVQSVNLEITDNDTKYEVVKEEDKLYLVSSDGVKVEIDLPEDIDTKYDLKLEDGKLTLIEDGEDKTTVTLPEIPEPKVYTLSKDADKVVLSDGEVTNEVDLSEYKNEPFPDLTGFAVKSEVETVLAEKADKTEIPDVSGFATKEELPDISSKADKSEIPDVSGFVLATAVTAALATKADKEEIPDVSNFATKDELPEVPDVSGFATKDEVTEAVSNKANKEDIPDVSGFAVETVVTEALAEKADKSEIPDVSNFATKDELPDISGKADKTEIPDVSGFAVKADVETALADKADKTEIPDVTGFATKEEVDKKLNIADEISYLLIQSFENDAINITLLDSKAEGSYEPTESTVAVKMNLRKDEDANQLVLEAIVADEVHEISRVQLASDSDTKYKLEKVDNQLRLIPVEDGVDGEAIVVDIEPDVNTTYTLSFDEENDVLTFTPSDDTTPTSINLGKFLTANDLAVFGFATTPEVNEALANKADKSEIPDVSGFALKTELPDISGKADKTEIPDVSGFAVKTEVESALSEKADKNTLFNDKNEFETLFTTAKGTAKIWNESDGGGAQYINTQGNVKSFVGVNDSDPDVTDAVCAQLYSVYNSTKGDQVANVGSRLNINPHGMFYTVGKNTYRGFTADDELATKKDIPDVSNFATKDELPEVPDVSGFAVATEVTAALSEKADKSEIPDISGFALKTELPDISGKADKEEIPDVSNFATKDELPEVPDVSGFAVKSEVDAALDEKLNAEEVVDYLLTQSYEDNGFNITLLDSSEKVGYIPVESTVNIKVTLRKDEEANQLVLEAHSGEDTYEVSRVQLATDSDTKYKLEKSGNQLRLIPVENGVDGQAIVVDIEPDVNTTYTLDFNNETNVLTFTPSDDTVPTVINLSKFANAVELANKVSITDFNSALNAKADKSEIPDVSGFAVKTEVESALFEKADKSDIPNVSGFATKNELTNGLKTKVDKEITTAVGTALIFNEADGGGAKFTNIQDNVKSFVGVNDGNKDGLCAQIYSVDSTTNEGTRLNVNQKGMYYTVGKTSYRDYTAGDELATKKDIPDVTGFALKTELPDISGKADKTEIPDVSNFATKDELPVVPDISGLAETTVVNEALALKADKTEIPDVSGFATKEELPDVTELFAKNAEISALKDQITVLTRALQDLKTPVVETVTELPNVTTSMPNDDIKLDDVTVPETTSYNDRKSVTAKSINAENMVMESSTITLNADGDVNVTGLTSSGNLPQLLPDAPSSNSKTNAAMSIHADGDVTIKDCTVGQSGYNTFEIGLNGGYPKNVIIDNVHFEGTLNNNAITIFGHQKNAIITISNCVFDKVSNPVRISNDTNQPATIKFVNCRCDKWEEKYPDYAGFLLLQDWKSANTEEFNTNKRFSNLTITFENCYGPNGKIEGTVEELISNTNKRAMYMYADKAGGIIGYNAELFPTVITK